MKKVFLIFVLLLFTTLFSCKKENVILSKINETNSYLYENELQNNAFSNVLQMKLSNSLVYNVNQDEYLIIYNDRNYLYSNNKLKEVKNSEYVIVDTIYDALKEEVGTKVITRGFYSRFDNGNAYYIVSSYNKLDNIFSVCDDNKINMLEYITYDSIINNYQMGYKIGDSLDSYVNKFTKELMYNYIFILEGKYKIVDNFDVSVSNKNYIGYNVELYSDDTYSPTGSNNGCLFYVYNNISNISIFGFSTNVIVNNKLADPLLGFLTARDVSNLFVNKCSFYVPKDAIFYDTSGLIDLFTNWKNVSVKNCHLENHASTVGGGGVGLRDIYKLGCENAVFENNYIYSNCKDEVIAIFSGGDTALYPDVGGGGYIKNVLFKNNTIIGEMPNSKLGPRVVGITVGYQLSLVSDIIFCENNIVMESANYLLLYGKTSNFEFKNNNVSINSSYKDDLYIMFYHNVYAQEAFDIVVDNNIFDFTDSSTFKTISQTGKEFKFTNNKITAKEVVRVFDSVSIFENNEINVLTINKCVYHNVKDVYGNKINAKYINVVFEFYNLNIDYDILIKKDVVLTESVGANFMMFNGDSIYFNDHKVQFEDFIFDTSGVNSQYYYIAYDTSVINDSLLIEFINSDISIYNDERHNFIAKDDASKVKINWI